MSGPIVRGFEVVPVLIRVIGVACTQPSKRLRALATSRQGSAPGLVACAESAKSRRKGCVKLEVSLPLTLAESEMATRP